MKRVISLTLSIFLLLGCVLPVFAADGVPTPVMEATKSVVRILSVYSNGSSTGSGFVIKNESGEVLIVTNDHVVEGNPYSVSVWISETRKVKAEIVFTVPERDLCVLKLKTSVDMKPLKLSREEPQHGAAIYAVGFPGAGDILSDKAAHTSDSATITDGIISAIRNFTIVKGGKSVKLLQVNAAINSGNSGGPLFNKKGEVIGINTYKVNAESQGVFGSVAVSELLDLLEKHNIEIPEAQNTISANPVWIAVGGVVLVFLLIVKKRGKSPKKTVKKEKTAQRSEEFVTLREYMHRWPNGLGVGTTVALLLPAAIELRNLHNGGKLHLQICPENILVKPFGNGSSLKEPTNQETDRFHSGFAAPEIYKGAGFGIASDVYSFGAVLYYTVTGRDPSNSLQRELLEQDLDGLADPSFAEVIRKAMAFAGFERTQSMQELIYGIASFNNHAQIKQTGILATMKKSEITEPLARDTFISVPAHQVQEENYSVENNKTDSIYNRAKTVMAGANTDRAFKAAARLFESVGKYKDAAVLAEECYEMAEKARKDMLLRIGKSKMCGEELSEYESAMRIFEELSGWKDADEQIQACQKKIEEIKAKKEILDRKKRKRANRSKIIAVAAAFVMCAVIGSIHVWNTVIIPNGIYGDAVALMSAGKYEEAISIFQSLDGYKDSAAQIENCYISIYGEELYNKFKLKVGDTYIFGKYEQDNTESNGQEDIEWIVVDKQDLSLCLVSKYALDCQQYDPSGKDAIWETSSIREWLNHSFLRKAFSSDERAMITIPRVYENNHLGNNTPLDNAIEDKVFLLSVSEANKYFSSDSERQCEPTNYAISNGVNSNGNNGNCWWWLRSSGDYKNCAACVGLSGSINKFGYHVDIVDGAIRPALWITLVPLGSESESAVDTSENILMGLGLSEEESRRIGGGDHAAKQIAKLPLFNTEALRKNVSTITFLDTMEDVPTNAVDASALGNGKVKAWAEQDGDLYDVYVAAEGGVLAPEDCSRLFSCMPNLTSIDFGNAFDTSKVTSMGSMFGYCKKLKALDLSSFDTSNVSDMGGTFYECFELESLNVTSFDTSNVTSMQCMFYACKRLKTLDVTGFNTSKVTNMQCMFLQCSSLKELNLSSFDVSNVTDAFNMFYKCPVERPEWYNHTMD